MEWFYYIEGEKTKFNWFLLEIALEYYSQIMRSTELETYRKQHSNKHIALYCTYYARRSKEDLLKVVKGRRKRMQVYEEYIFDYYPNHEAQLNKKLCEIGSEAWNHMLNACANCPQQCLVDYQSVSSFFEDYK